MPKRGIKRSVDLANLLKTEKGVTGFLRSDKGYDSMAFFCQMEIYQAYNGELQTKIATLEEQKGKCAFERAIKCTTASHALATGHSNRTCHSQQNKNSDR